MHISGMSGNEIYCLAQKGFVPGEIAVGNSVCSLGFGGALGSLGRSLAGGEIHQVTALISEGRHAAITRMEEEAKRTHARGVTGVDSTLGSLGGYMEFLAQGTAVHGDGDAPFFSSAASGVELYCHLDAGYAPRRFVMGNIAFALGIGRGLTGSLRTLGRGEVREFSSMYNEIRHTALERLEAEARASGANAVVDVQIRMVPYGIGAVELLLTGTASSHAALPAPHASSPVVTSELSGEELWNLAALGLAPRRLVMATSVYSLGVAAGLGTLMKSLTRGELPELTKLVYQARENAIDLVRKEAESIGAERVIGNRLQIREIGSGLVEVVAIGTAVSRADYTKPASPVLIPQAVISDKSSRAAEASFHGIGPMRAPMDISRGVAAQGASPLAGIIILLVVMMTMCCSGILAAIADK